MPQQSTKVERTCPICGTVFLAFRSAERIYCSRVCYHQSRRTGPVGRIDFTCPVCGSVFQDLPSAKKRGKTNYCSRSCLWRRARGDAIDRFMGHVRKTDGCWLWIGDLNADGYGRFWDSAKKVLAHRWSYEHFVGGIPNGLVIDHVRERGCTNTNCVRPDHLEPVTQAVNLQRARNATH